MSAPSFPCKKVWSRHRAEIRHRWTGWKTAGTASGNPADGVRAWLALTQTVDSTTGTPPTAYLDSLPFSMTTNRWFEASGGTPGFPTGMEANCAGFPIFATLIASDYTDPTAAFETYHMECPADGWSVEFTREWTVELPHSTFLADWDDLVEAIPWGDVFYYDNAHNSAHAFRYNTAGAIDLIPDTSSSSDPDVCACSLPDLYLTTLAGWAADGKVQNITFDVANIVPLFVYRRIRQRTTNSGGAWTDLACATIAKTWQRHRLTAPDPEAIPANTGTWERYRHIFGEECP